MLYVEDDIRTLASERSHGMRTNVRGEQRICINSESILLVNIRRHRTGGEVLCVRSQILGMMEMHVIGLL